MDVEIVPTLKTDMHSVANGSSPGANLGSDPGQVGVKEYGVEFEPDFSVPELVGHRSILREDAINMEDVQESQEQAEQVANTKEVELKEEREVHLELSFDSPKSQSKEEKNTKCALKSVSLVKDHCVNYQLPPENEGEFAVFDLVWGKVKSHPWWPGQIFYPSDSSEKAMKYYKKDCYLVAYFGDRTFAWNDASVLKPFRSHFSQAERQNNSEAFQNAVTCALKEVSRRVELGLACSCVSDETYDKIKYQIVDNSGIREESSQRGGVDRSTGVNSFQPDKLVEYVRALSLFPTTGADRLELAIAEAQLLAFNQLRGYDALPDFQYYEGLVEVDADTTSEDQGISRENGHAKKGPRKRKHDLRDIVYRRRKEKSVLELMGDTMYCLDGEFESYDEDDHNMGSRTSIGKRRASGFLTDDFTSPRSTQTISLAKISHEAPPSHQSFKVGDRIRRAAFQMTGSAATIKGSTGGSNKKYSEDDADELSKSPGNSLESTPLRSKESSLENMLSQLHLSAQNPMKGYSFLSDIISFFSEFRNLAVTTQRQKLRKRKKKSPVPVVGSPENFEFEDRNDSYWTDMVVQGDAEAKLARRGRKRKEEKVLSDDHGNPPQRKPRKYTRKMCYQGCDKSVVEMPIGDKQLDLPTGEKQLDLPTELMLKFSEMGSIPSEVSLNKMFRCFGPLKESETEVDMQSSSARVVFKKRSDAEVAFSSAATFNIFGSTLVNFQLNYTPSTSFRSSALALSNVKEDGT